MKHLMLATSILLGVCVLGGCNAQDNDGGELVDAQENAEEVEKGISQAESGLEEMKDNLDGLREELTEKNTQIQKLSEENEELRRKVNALEADLAEYRKPEPENE